jgi:S1/P1 Nuclease
MRAVPVILSAVLVVLIGTNSAFAWNDVGHLTIARIAWERLADSQRDAVVNILRRHPHYKNILLASRPEDASEAEWIFVRAAVWPDHVRPPRTFSREDAAAHPIHAFHRGSWHYVNFPYRAGQTETALPARPIESDEPNPTNILDQLALSMKVLMGESNEDDGRVEGVTNDENKAVRMCWLMHLVGDLHQLLHVASLVDEEKFSRGEHFDLGGNLIVIRTHIGGPAYKLHAFWDDRLGTDSHFPTIRSHAELLYRDPHLAPQTLPELATHPRFRDWAAESYALAKSHAYREGQLPFALSNDFEYRRIRIDDVPVLPQGVEAEANKVARRRIVLAGYRLAEAIEQIVGR